MSSRTVVRLAAAVMAVVGTLKFVGLFVESGFDLSVSPWGFLLVFVLPFILVSLLGGSRPRAAAVLMVVAGSGTLVFLGAGLLSNGFVLHGWGDQLVGYLGTVAVAVGVVAAARSLVTRRRVPAH